jgi:2-amino-4-hydroxy-6-hydroxymethyldihydropteridine diphosphokinase
MKAYLSIGANLGERKNNLRDALNRLRQEAGRIIALSPLYETEPVGFKSSDLFLNQVAIIETNLSPVELLGLIKKIEIDMGRIRNEERYVSRKIDIDIVFYENRVIESTELVIPHPRMHERRFVLEPLCVIAPDFIHPVLNQAISEILETLEDKSPVKQVD